MFKIKSIFNEFFYKQYIFKDIENIQTKDEISRFSSLVREELLKFPIEIICKTPSNFKLFKQKIENLYFNDPKVIVDQINFYKNVEPLQMKSEDFVGTDMFPLTFVLYENRNIIGGLQLYGIQILERKENIFVIKANIFPIISEIALFNTTEWFDEMANLFKELLTLPLITKDGTTIIIQILDPITLGPGALSNSFIESYCLNLNLRLSNDSQIEIISTQRNGLTYNTFGRKDGKSSLINSR